MSIVKCFSNTNNSELKALFQDKIDRGFTEDSAAASTIMEYAQNLSDRNNALRQKLGLAEMPAPNLNELKDIVEANQTIEELKDGENITEPYEQEVDRPIEVDESQIEFVHRLPDGTITKSYAEALNSVEEGQQIEVGMQLAENEFVPIVTTRKNTNRNNVEGFINNMIANGALEERKVPTMQGTMVYEAAGPTDLRKAFSMALVQDQGRVYLGQGGVNQDGMTFNFEKVLGQTSVMTGNFMTTVPQEYLDGLSYEELRREFGQFTAVTQVANREYEASKPAYRDTPINTQSAGATMSDEQLQMQIMNLLNKMGIKVVSIAEYTRKYKLRNGVNPSAKALADIANQVIAVTEGRVGVDTLAEEAAHFINEAMPQDQVRNLLRNIHRTEEYAQFAEIYREIYRDEYPADQLEDVVRREVLGKIVAKVMTKPGAVENAQNETQRNFFQRTIEAIQQFFQRLADLFQPAYRQELDSYLQEVEKLLSADEIAGILNTTNFEHNTFRFYDIDTNVGAIEKIRRVAAGVAVKMIDAQKTMLNAQSGIGKRSDLEAAKRAKETLEKAEEINDELEKALQVNGVASIVSMLDSSVRRLEKSMEASEKDTENDTYYFTDEENVLFQFVKSIGKGGIEEIRQLAREVRSVDIGNEAQWDPIIKAADELALRMGALETRAKLIDSQNVKRLVDKTLDKYNIPPNERAIVEAWIDRAKKDTDLFHMAFGQLVHAQDGLLNLAGRIFRQMRNEGYVKFYFHTKKYQDRLRELGVSEAEVNQFAKDGYLLDTVDHAKFQKFLADVEMESYREALNKSIENMQKEIDGGAPNAADLQRRIDLLRPHAQMETEELLKLKKERALLPLTLEEETMKKNISRGKLKGKILKPMKDEYYDKYDKMITRLDISEDTRQSLSNIMSDMGDLRKKAYRRLEDGRLILDYSQLSESDLASLKDLQKARKDLKSYTMENGMLKPGLWYRVGPDGRVVRDADGNLIVEAEPGMPLSKGARAALDIHKLDAELPKNEKEKTAQLFFDTVEQIQKERGREAALRFVEANAFITFDQKFWDSLGTNTSISDRLDSLVEEDPTVKPQVDVIKEELQITSFMIKNIMRTHSKKNNPAEIDVSVMSSTTQETIAQLQERLQKALNEAHALVGKPQVTEEEAVKAVVGTSDVNESYRQALKDENMDEESFSNADPTVQFNKAVSEMEFAMKHMTPYAASTMMTAHMDLERYAEGRGNKLPKQFQLIMEELGKTPDDVKTDMALRAQMTRILARKKVLPYFKRFTPPSYTRFYEDMKKSPNIAKHLQSQAAKDAFVQVDPNYSFFSEEENENINPDFVQDYEGGYLQPDPNQFRNEEYFKMFGNVVDGVPERNQRLFDAYQATLEYNRAALEAMNAGENYNKFKLPQIRKAGTQRLMDMVSRSRMRDNVKNTWKNAMQYTEDDMIKGDQSYGDDVKIIPKMYLRDLENPEDLTDDIFWALTMRAKEGFLRESRVKHYGDLMSIQDKLLTREINGKDPDKSNTYKMFKSALDNNMFNIRETMTQEIKTPFGTVDIAKIGRMILNFVKFRNLGLNLIIPATSALTGMVTRKMEAIVGEHLDTRSQRLGAREFTKLMPTAMPEMGKINQKSKLNAMGQFFGAFDMEDTFKSSSYNWFFKNMPRIGMFLHSAANFPLYSKAMLGILHDFRVIDGQVMDRNQFRNIKKAEGLSASEMKAEWNKAEGETLYKYMEHEGNKVDYNKAALRSKLKTDGRDMNDEEFDAYMRELHNNVQGKIQFVNSIIDGQIPEDDRVYAQRHFLLSYLMTHRGWLSIAMSRRFKNRHLNLDTQVLEEGTYRSFFGYMGDVAKEVFQDPKKILSAWKAEWNKIGPETELRRKNMRRMGVEMGGLASLMVLALALRAAAEDPDNEDIWGLQLANYLTFRTINELSSVQGNIVSNFGEAVESPFVGWSVVKGFMDLGDVLNGEEVKYGPYKGMTKRDKYLIRMIPGIKQGFDLWNMNQTYDTYKFYNLKNFSMAPANVIWANTIDAPKE